MSDQKAEIDRLTAELEGTREQYDSAINQVKELAMERNKLRADIKFQIELEREACVQVALCIGEDAGNAIAAAIRLRKAIANEQKP